MYQVIIFHWTYHRRFNPAVFTTAVNTKMEPGAMEAVLEQQQQQQQPIGLLSSTPTTHTYDDILAVGFVSFVMDLRFKYFNSGFRW